MKTIKARNNSGDDWKTPSDFYQKLDAIYHFDFDPCPYQADFDGLKVEWGRVNFINPPYTRKLKEAFVEKALEESRKGKTCGQHDSMIVVFRGINRSVKSGKEKSNNEN